MAQLPFHLVKETVSDSLFADVSYFQAPVDDSYPYRVLSIRSNDGTFRDANFAHNYQWCVNACDSGRLAFFIVYYYWRPGYTGIITHMNMVGTPHPKMVTMIDLESGGNPSGSQMGELDDEYNQLAAWLGNPLRVISYANSSDYYNMWPGDPSGLRWVGAGYPTNPNLPNQIAHQYTDGVIDAGGLPMGAPPFGNCDMNSADGLTPEQFAAACGVGTSEDTELDATQAHQLQVVYDKIAAYPDNADIGGKWQTRARYAPVPSAKVDDTVGMMLWTDANGFDLMVEFAASQGYNPAKQLIAARAAAHPDDAQAVFYHNKYPPA